MKEHELDSWWNSLGWPELFHIMYIPDYEDDNDFIDKCDEYWDSLTYEEKLSLYENFD